MFGFLISSFVLVLSLLLVISFLFNKRAATKFSYYVSLLCMVFNLGFLISFQPDIFFGYQFIFDSTIYLNTYNYNINLGFRLVFDGLALLFILLTNLIFSCIYYWLVDETYTHTEVNDSLLIFLLNLLHLIMVITFLITDILLFYYLFEAILIPMYLLIYIWGGSKGRKIKAAFYFVFYTLAASVCLLYSLLYLQYTFGSLDLLFYKLYFKKNLNYINNFLFWSFFFAFAVKAPIIPLHVWLPEAHVEAPTVGSVVLAGLLLKLSGFGLLRFLIPLFKSSIAYFYPIILTICCLSIFYGSLIVLSQVDLKKIVAYSSIIHMNFALIGLLSLTFYGIQGGIFLMLMHGLVSSGLFFIIGVLYKRYGTRLLNYYSGLTELMPLFSFCFFMFSLSNLGFPLTGNFIAELLIFIGFTKTLTVDLSLIFIGLSFILAVIYCIWVYNRICFGTISPYISKFYFDLTLIEWNVFLMLIVWIIFSGIYPYFFLKFLTSYTYFLLSL